MEHNIKVDHLIMTFQQREENYKKKSHNKKKDSLIMTNSAHFSRSQFE